MLLAKVATRHPLGQGKREGRGERPTASATPPVSTNATSGRKGAAGLNCALRFNSRQEFLSETLRGSAQDNEGRSVWACRRLFRPLGAPPFSPTDEVFPEPNLGGVGGVRRRTSWMSLRCARTRAGDTGNAPPCATHATRPRETHPQFERRFAAHRPVSGNALWVTPSSRASPLPASSGSRSRASRADKPRSATSGLLA